MLSSHTNSLKPQKSNTWTLSWRLQLVLGLYRCAWLAFLPVALAYLLNKSRKEPMYRAHWAERFGVGGSTLKAKDQDCASTSRTKKRVWVHCASLGELRGVAPLINALLAQGDHLLISTLTPAGRLGAQQLFASAMHDQRLQVVWVPLEIKACVLNFIRHHQPDMALMSEIDTWPVLLTAIKSVKLPLGFVNAQYPEKSFIRDARWWGLRSELFRAYDLILCKSSNHAQRFASIGCTNIQIVGETRFDLPIPQHQLIAAQHFTQQATSLFSNRPVICIASCVEGEEIIFIDAIQQVNAQRAAQHLNKPLWIIVPRSPQRFERFYDTLRQTCANGDQGAAPLAVIRRSTAFDSTLKLHSNTPTIDTDILLGDSLGEMYFYLALSQMVVVGASFVPLGSHNVIEPLALKKPVLVGPSVWGIEFPGVEAMKAGVLKQCASVSDLVSELLHLSSDPAYYQQITHGCDGFYQLHCGSAQRHLKYLNAWQADTHLTP
jgi:3-deoxy-D-manno-octulosonic-acid transferase